MQSFTFSNTELHFIMQGIQKIINESRQHIEHLTSCPLLESNGTEATLIEYYDKRIRINCELMKKISAMHHELAICLKEKNLTEVL